MSRLSATIAYIEAVKESVNEQLDLLIENLKGEGLPQGEYVGEEPAEDETEEPDGEVDEDPDPEPEDEDPTDPEDETPPDETDEGEGEPDGEEPTGEDTQPGGGTPPVDPGPAPDPGNASVDVVVSTWDEVRAQLDFWQSAQPDGPRTIGLNAVTRGREVIADYHFNHPVFIRHVGNFTAAADGTPDCSVYHEWSGSTLNTANLFANCTNVYLYRMNFKAMAKSGNYNEVMDIKQTKNCGLINCAFHGKDQVAQWAVVVYENTDLTIKNTVSIGFKDGPFRFFDQITNMLYQGNMGRNNGGDFNSCAANAKFVDPLIRCNFYDRRRRKVVGLHADDWQFNKAAQIGNGAHAVRWISEFDVSMRGPWTGAIANPNETGQAVYFTATNGNGGANGPHVHRHCLLMNGHQRAITGMPGGGLSAINNTVAQHDNDQPPAAGWPFIRGTETSVGNLCTEMNPGFPASDEGAGGVKITMGGNSNGTGADFSKLLEYFATVPTNHTDLWDIRPLPEMRSHPDHATPVGAFGLWAKLFGGDDDIVLSKAGWPVAPMFIADYDRGDNFWGGYTGSFDADGNVA